MKFINTISPLLLTLIAAASLSTLASASERRANTRWPVQVNAAWEQECSSCHVAYPPAFLPAASWRKLTSTLDKHFGVDASLPPEQTTEVTNFLVKNAASRWSGSAAPLRITESRWYTRQHNSEEISPAVWKRVSVKSHANCGACHGDAAKGIFSEDTVKIPK